MHLTIGKPYIETLENGKVRLVSVITRGMISDLLYYEVDSEYKDYLVVDRCDCFVLGLIHECMNTATDIVCEAPITNQLLFQIQNQYIPVMAENMPDLQRISITAETINPIESNVKAVATGNSGGIDSFFTILKHFKGIDGYALTHLLLNNISTEDDNNSRIRAWFEEERKEKQMIADEFGLKAIFMYTNLYSFYTSHFIYNYYFNAQYISAPTALGKLVHAYYYSSSYSFKDFTIDHTKMTDGSNCDLLGLQCFSTSNMTIYSIGGEVGRIDKTIEISSNEVAQRHLTVCAVNQNKIYNEQGKVKTKLNCGHCRKCTRTISIFYAINTLDSFKEVFDLSEFNQYPEKYIGRELASDLYEFADELRMYLKKNGKYNYKIMTWNALYKLRYTMAKSKRLVKLFHAMTKK